MTFDFFNCAVLAGLAAIIALQLQQRRFLMATAAELQAAVDQLQADVTAESGVVDSAILLIDNIAQMLKDALASGGTSDAIVAQVQGIVSVVDASKQKLADAVAANTPTPPPAP